ncbi:hypothetical protein IEQ34_012578 [Dendrobium chrysotoxum]|uniref:Sm domain-containing protein n=1 Tax=Dendrobium chrysotoxum TaxID=161865 RepID=A0AAV7GDB0_DENCH|nr:hypothetical protein IEQ34_012578 [Dendrobium chrysotoxum]
MLSCKELVGFEMLFFSYFKKLVGKEVTAELKNDLAIRSILHSLDQYLNIELENTRIESSYQLKQSRGASSQANIQTKEKVLLGRQKQGATGALDEEAWTVGSEHQSPPFILVGVLRAIPPGRSIGEPGDDPREGLKVKT